MDELRGKMDEWGRKIIISDDRIKITDKKLDNLVLHFGDMKRMFDQAVNETHEFNQASQDLTLQVKQECLIEVKMMMGKLDVLEKMRSDLKRVEQNFLDEMIRVNNAQDETKRKAYTFQTETHRRITEFEAEFTRKTEKTIKDVRTCKFGL